MGLLWFNLIMLAFYFPSLILHEYGHALVGRLIGLSLKSVSIGKGESYASVIFPSLESTYGKAYINHILQRFRFTVDKELPCYLAEFAPIL